MHSKSHSLEISHRTRIYAKIAVTGCAIFMIVAFSSLRKYSTQNNYASRTYGLLWHGSTDARLENIISDDNIDDNLKHRAEVYEHVRRGMSSRHILSVAPDTGVILMARHTPVMHHRNRTITLKTNTYTKKSSRVNSIETDFVTDVDTTAHNNSSVVFLNHSHIVEIGRPSVNNSRYRNSDTSSSSIITESHTLETTRNVVKDPVMKIYYTYDTECHELHNNVSDVCVFVATVSDCHSNVGLLNYIKWVYCSFSATLIPLAIALLSLWLVFLFISLAVTADDFFCPSLAVISKTLKLSHNIAGVTFLAFGNGAPDIFSAISAVNSAKGGNAGLAFGALFGAGMFVTTVVAGTIVVIKPFHIMTRPFLRDIIFYIAAAYWAFYTIWDRRISKGEAIGFIGLYVVYVLVVVIGRYIRQKYTHRVLNIQQIDAPATVDEHHEVCGYSRLPQTHEGDGDNESFDHTKLFDHSRLIRMDHPVNCVDYCESFKDNAEKTVAVKKFLSAISPLSMEQFKQDRLHVKIYNVVKAPIMFLLTITIPLVNHEAEMNNWNRHLNCLQCIIGPLFAVFVTQVAFTNLGGVFPVYALVLLTGCLLAVVVFFTSTNCQPPRYHALFAYLGFVIAIVWIYTIANEIVSILKLFGIVFNIPNAVLGLTLLAWGNSIGDMITNTVMARQGYPKVGISACFGGPLFNLLMGIGISFTIQTFKLGEDIKPRLKSWAGYNAITILFETKLIDVMLISFLLGSLVSSLVIVVASWFYMSRAYGVFLWCYYAAFIVVSMLTAFGVIHVQYFE